MEHWKERGNVLATEHGDGLSAHPERDCPDSPWLEWQFRFRDSAGRRRCITLGQWPFIGESEAREMAESLRTGDWRTVSRVMLRYGELRLFESRVVDQMGENGIEAAIERERAWVRYTSRARHWPRLEKAEARQALDHLESVLRRMRSFARARGLRLQTATSDGKLRATA
jgi:hypothetical protein